MKILNLLVLFTFINCFAPPPRTKEECRKANILSIIIPTTLPEYDKDGERTYREIFFIEALKEYQKCLDEAPNNPIIRRKL